jgi:excisionase family DNA binding protein
MTYVALPQGDPLVSEVVGAVGEEPRVREVVRHVTVALSRHVRQLHVDGVPVPREVEELTAFLVHLARIRHGSPEVAGTQGIGQHPVLPDRMLVTKHEAAQLLGVSVRTVERLVAAGRLQQVQVERLARFRVGDLEAYVHGLAQATN